MRRVVVQAILIASVAARSAAQSADPSPSARAEPSSQSETWSGRGSTAFYALPDAKNYLQPTAAADRDALPTGIVPALELDLAWKRLEFYTEDEYVIDVIHPRDRFFYSWSETSVWITDRIRTGLVTQRTRVFHEPHDIRRGLLLGATLAKFEGAVYFFNPNSNDRFYVASIGVTF